MKSNNVFCFNHLATKTIKSTEKKAWGGTRFFALFCGFLGLFNFASAQIEHLEKTRYRFAQTTIGYDMDYTPINGQTYLLNDLGNLVAVPMGNDLAPSITITGLHFWGHAEFFTGFSLGNINLSKDENKTHYFRSAATGGKYFPWQLKPNKIRPFTGMAVSTFRYQQGDGVVIRRVDFPLLAGVSYSFKRGVFEIGANWYYDRDEEYYITKEVKVPIKIPPLTFFADFKYFFDFSIASEKMEADGTLDRYYKEMKEKGLLNTFSIGAGPAYSFFTGHSTYNEKYHPYLDDYAVSQIFPDLALGYYFYRIDALVNFSFRTMYSERKAFDMKQKVNRTSYAIELYKFFWDYHGFVPFAGVIGSYESLSWATQQGNVSLVDERSDKIVPGLIVGWDIRPTRTDFWGIRTNIRYFPSLKLPSGNGTYLDFQQIELNFLQLILYPNRLYYHLKH